MQHPELYLRLPISYAQNSLIPTDSKIAKSDSLYYTQLDWLL